MPGTGIEEIDAVGAVRDADEVRAVRWTRSSRRTVRCWMRLLGTGLGRCWPRRLRAEVAAYIEANAGGVDADGRRLVVRNGFHEARKVTTSAGAVPVQQPRINDKRVDPVTGERKRFSSAILPAWSRKSPRVAEVLPLLHLHGLSSSDFGSALEQFLGSDQVCRRRRGSCPRWL